MDISIIVAMGRNNVIGKNNKMPWNLPEDLKYFKEVTMGHSIICGRKTLESMNGPLKDRRNVVLTRDKDFKWDNCEVIHSVEEALGMFKDCDEEVFVTGGEEIYRLFLPLTNKLYITEIDESFEGDTFFPKIINSQWQLISEKKGLKDEDNPYEYTYKIYERMDKVMLNC